MQVDNVCFHIGLYAFHSCSVLPKILYNDSRRIIRRIRRRTALVRKMYLFNCSGRSLLNCLGYSRKCSCHKILRPLLHVLSNGAGVGKSYIFSRWVILRICSLRIYADGQLYLGDYTCREKYLHINYFVFDSDDILLTNVNFNDAEWCCKNKLIVVAMLHGIYIKQNALLL